VSERKEKRGKESEKKMIIRKEREEERGRQAGNLEGRPRLASGTCRAQEEKGGGARRELC